MNMMMDIDQPTLISNGFSLFVQQSPLLTTYTSDTGSIRSRSTLHQGFSSRFVREHNPARELVLLFPSTALYESSEEEL